MSNKKGVLRHTIIGLILSAVLAAPVAWAGLLEGMNAYINGDYATALREFRPLAEQGNALFQVRLGFMYHKGEGVTQDYAEAVKWYRKAAEQGDAEAQVNLGNMYFKGQGVTQDYAETVKWYRKAAEPGDAFAQANLGLMYYLGHGVAQDYVQAHMWLNLAAAQGYTAAVKLRDRVASKMTPNQIAEAQRRAREWKPK